MPHSDEEQCIQRYVRFQSLDVHPTQKALVVCYDVDPNMLAQLGFIKECQKVVRLKGSFDAEEVPVLAELLVDTCPLLPPSKQPHVEQLLYYLSTRNGGSVCLEEEDGECEAASVANIDSYIELLYEEIDEKVRASALVLQLAQQTGNLDVLRKNEILLGALARVLREDGRKSIELSTNIVQVFHCFSVFTQFHSVIAQHKMGSLCIDVVEGELKRHEQWAEEITRKKTIIDSGKTNSAVVNDYEKSLQKYLSLVQKQNQLLKVCLLLLLHVAEDAKVEQKMVHRGVVPLLVQCVRPNAPPELLTVALSFLLKLSIFHENKTQMECEGVVEVVSPLVPHENAELLEVALKLLLNLSFSLESRNAMVKCGLLHKLVNLMEVKTHQNAVLSILYHISFDDRCKSLFTYTDCIPMLMRALVDEKGSLSAPLVALAANLASNKRSAQLMCEGEGLRHLVERAFSQRDLQLLRVVRNIAQHPGPTRTLFVNFADVLCEAVHGGEEDDFLLECVGVMGHLSLAELDYEALLFRWDLLGFLKSKLSQTTCPPQWVLELVSMTATFAAEGVCAAALLDAGIIRHVIDHLNAKQEDDEIVLHIVYLFYQLIYHRATREAIIRETQIPGYLLDLMHDKNTEIRKLCDRSLEIISEWDECWAKKIQLEKFRWHNCQWLEMVESQQADDFVEDSYTPRIQDFLDPAELLYASGAYESLLSDESLSPDVPDDSLGSRPKSRYKNRLISGDS